VIDPTVHRLSPSGREAFRTHLLALPQDDIRLRFGNPLGPAAIAAYVDSIDFERDAVFAVHDNALAIVGAAHVGFFEDAAELGVSVLPDQRGRGVGSALVFRASEHARNRRTIRLYMHCLAENAAMMTIARRTGMSIVVSAGEVDAHLALPPASAASVTREYFSDQLALVDYAQKSYIDTLRRAAEAVRKS
jgi:GNAT superfamily N-acetyltransferase